MQCKLIGCFKVVHRDFHGLKKDFVFIIITAANLKSPYVFPCPLTMNNNREVILYCNLCFKWQPLSAYLPSFFFFFFTTIFPSFWREERNEEQSYTLNRSQHTITQTPAYTNSGYFKKRKFLTKCFLEIYLPQHGRKAIYIQC